MLQIAKRSFEGTECFASGGFSMVTGAELEDQKRKKLAVGNTSPAPHGPMSDSASASQDSEESDFTRPNSAIGDGNSSLEKRARHKLVEQNRREKKRALTNELQELLPALRSCPPGTSINVVLEGVLDFLQGDGVVALREKKAPEFCRPSSDSSVSSDSSNTSNAKSFCQKMMASFSQGHIPRNFTSGMFGGAFDSAPMGIIMASTSGEVLRCNNIFFNIFGLDMFEAKPTMFNLTAPESLPMTMQAANALLTGQLRHVKVIKRCLRKGGTADEFQVEMNCIHKNNKPAYFVCYVRHTSKTLTMGNSCEVTELYKRNHSAYVKDGAMTNYVVPIEEDDVNDPDMDELFKTLANSQAELPF